MTSFPALHGDSLPMKRAVLFKALSMALLPLAGAAASQAQKPLMFEHALGGRLAEPVVADDHAYVPNGRVITVVDYGDFLAPRLVGDTRAQPASGYIVGLARAGRFLYAAWDTQGEDSGVAVYSLVTPERPVLVSEVRYSDAPFRNAHSLAASGGYLYLFDSEHGLFVGDLADPARPAFAHAVADSTYRQRAYVQDGRLYAVGRSWIGETTLETFDLSVPSAPVPIGIGYFDGNANFSFELRTPLAFGYGYGFHVHDVTDPSNPVLLSSDDDDGRVSFNGVNVGAMAYAFGATDIGVWEITDPAAPFQFEPSRADVFATDVAVPFGRHAWLGTRADQLIWLDLGIPHHPKVASELLLPGAVDAYDIGFIGGKALILQNTYGLQVADARTLAPESRFVADLPPVLQARAFEQMAIAGDHAYLASWGYGLIVVDLADPSQPVERGRWPSSSATTVDVAGRYAYVGRSSLDNGGVTVVDVADASTPVPLGNVSGIQAMQLKAGNGHVFVADGNAQAGLRVLDVADPEAPVQVAHYRDDCSSALAVALDSDARTAYVLCSSGLHVVDVSVPAAPTRLGRYDFGGTTAVGAVAVDGDRLYLGTDHGFDEVDVGDHEQPRRVARHATASTPRAVRLGPGGRVYVMTDTAGLHVFRREALFANGFEPDAR